MISKETFLNLYANHRFKKFLMLVLNFTAASILFYPIFPELPILFMLALAISITCTIVPILSMVMAILLYSSYLYVVDIGYGIIVFFNALMLFLFDTKGKKDIWLFLILTTPIFIKYQAPFLPIFLTIILVKENWESTSFMLTFQTAFFATFIGNYPWGYSETKINLASNHITHNFSRDLTNQFNAMNYYDPISLNTFLIKNLLFFMIFIIALKVITTIVGKIIFSEKDSNNRKHKELLGLSIGMILTFILSSGLSYIRNNDYFLLKSLLYVTLSFIPVFIVFFLSKYLHKFNTCCEINNMSQKYSWESIGGYDDVKEEISEAIRPYINKEECKRIEDMGLSIVKGILLYGPPGVGKTLFSRVIASEAKMHFIPVKCSDFLSKWVGESEAQLKNIFLQARQNAPSIIFFDEIEAFVMPRINLENSWEQTLVNTFLAEMDGFKELKNVLVIGATNFPNKIDPAVIRPGRFDKIIYIPHPDEDARKAIFSLYLKDKPVKEKIDLDLMVKNSERYTPADICSVVAEAYRTNSYTAVSNDDLLKLLKQNKASITYELLDTYKEFSIKFGRRKFIENSSDEFDPTKLTWDSMAGMEDVKDEIKRYIELPLKNSEIYEMFKIKQSKGVLLFGPPGCGKTLLAKILRDQCKASFFQVKCSEILRSQTGESENKVKEIFRKAKENKPSIIFFDELDALGETRGSRDVKVVEQMLLEMDMTDELKNVFVVGATNRIDAIDKALLRPGRFDKLIFIGLPDYDSRKKLVELNLSGRKSQINLDEAARLTLGYTGAEIEYIINRSVIFVAEDYIKGNIRSLIMKDLYDSINSTPRSITESDINYYTKLSKQAR